VGDSHLGGENSHEFLCVCLRDVQDIGRVDVLVLIEVTLTAIVTRARWKGWANEPRVDAQFVRKMRRLKRSGVLHGGSRRQRAIRKRIERTWPVTNRCKDATSRVAWFTFALRRSPLRRLFPSVLQHSPSPNGAPSPFLLASPSITCSGGSCLPSSSTVSHTQGLLGFACRHLARSGGGSFLP
jgi:hypothetical protein